MNHNQVEPIDIDNIIALLGSKERVLSGAAIKEEYSHDELSGTAAYPDIVVQAASAAEVAKVLRYANERLIPVTPRGAGTGLVGASVAVNGGILLDVAAMDKILELDEANLTLTVEPGVLLMDLAAYVEERGFFYPPDPGEKSATIGGNISTNAGGMRAVKYGVTRDYVRSLEVVLADGSMLSVGGKIVKNSSGYALKDLLIGAEGTLGVITKAVLKLLPLPAKNISLLVPFATLQQAINTVPLIIAAKAIPTAIEFMEKEVILDAEEYLGRKFPDHQADAYLLLKFDGNTQAEITAAYEQVAELCLAQGALDVLLADTAERNESIWQARGAFLEAIKGSTTNMDEVDVVVPRSEIAAMVEYTHQLRQELGIRIKSFGHAGDGNLHVYILQDDMADAVWQQTLTVAMDKLYAKSRELNGKVSGEHGIGYAKRRYLAEAESPTALALMRGIKQVFDPHLILNPRKISDIE